MIYTFELHDDRARPYDLQIGVFDDDHAAYGAAASLLTSHARASLVTVWDVDRKVGQVAVQPPGAA